MSRYVDLNNPKIFHNGRDKFGNCIYHIPPDLPTDDAVERKKGKWIYKYYVWSCSECGNCPTKGMGYVQRRDELYDFCPHCGAQMEVE